VSRNVIDALKQNRAMVAAVAIALISGLGAGYWLSRGPGSSGGKPDQPIEWHAVQAVPTRAPDAEDVEWQDRSNAIDAAEAAEANEAAKEAANEAAETR
jgi:hypothetical protein